MYKSKFPFTPLYLYKLSIFVILHEGLLSKGKSGVWTWRVYISNKEIVFRTSSYRSVWLIVSLYMYTNIKYTFLSLFLGFSSLFFYYRNLYLFSLFLFCMWCSWGTLDVGMVDRSFGSHGGRESSLQPLSTTENKYTGGTPRIINHIKNIREIIRPPSSPSLPLNLRPNNYLDFPPDVPLSTLLRPSKKPPFPPTRSSTS